MYIAQKGFTLIEVIVVIAIIGLLAVIVAPTKVMLLEPKFQSYY
ncbi:prepilin-type N-terminal cleavage/methylation domain-containing protein [Psychrobacter submarinus]|nr:prepilin-type N-terminal cleavage/methylation domain-containing protein [Psychrobacter submarinus]